MWRTMSTTTPHNTILPYYSVLMAMELRLCQSKTNWIRGYPVVCLAGICSGNSGSKFTSPVLPPYVEQNRERNIPYTRREEKRPLRHASLKRCPGADLASPRNESKGVILQTFSPSLKIFRRIRVGVPSRFRTSNTRIQRQRFIAVTLFAYMSILPMASIAFILLASLWLISWSYTAAFYVAKTQRTDIHKFFTPHSEVIALCN